jgi:transcriptional regulator with XRE-family HTH domain
MDKRVQTLAEFGQIVRDVRKSSPLRQVDAAHLIGVSPPVLNKLEQGREVWLSKALEICNSLGIEVVLRTHD